MVDFQSQDPARIKLYINIIGDKTVLALCLFCFVSIIFYFVFVLFFWFYFFVLIVVVSFYVSFLFFNLICSAQTH